MIQISIGSSTATLSKLLAHSVGETLINRFPDLKIDYHYEDSISENTNSKLDLVVLSPYELELEKEVENHSNIITLLPRSEQREIILFKKEITASRTNQIQLFCLDPINLQNTSSFLREYLPLSIQNKEIKITPYDDDLVNLLRHFLSSELDAIALPKICLDRLLSIKSEDKNQEDFHNFKQIAAQVVSNSLFLIPPLSLCPNYPAEGIIFGDCRSDSMEIQKMIHSISEPEVNMLAEAERNFAKEMTGSTSHSRLSLLQRPYGTIEYLRDSEKTNSLLKDSCEDKFQIHEIWPPNAKMSQRQRERLDYKIPPNSDLYVSRGYAYPLDLVTDPSQQIIWTAGLSTWKDLTNRNLWVHGTSDGLGESEPTRLSIILGRKLNFVKLSHLDSDTSFNTYPLISTYRLSSPEIPNNFDPSKIKAAYWRSISEFERITTRFPELKEVIHFVSPGSTYMKIQKELGHKANFRLHVALSFDGWRNQNIHLS